jgi:hypothetical protein
VTPRLGAPGIGQANPAELSLFGGFELKLGGKKVSLPMHARRVLAYLSVNKMVARDCDRQVLADRLWTESPPERSRASLCTAIWRIRCIHAELLAGDSERVALADAVSVDVHEFRRHAEEMLSDEVDWRPPIQVPLLRSPCELLPGWDEDWLLLTREQLRLLRLHALEHLAKRMCERGFYPQAIDTILRVVVEEPLRESAQTRSLNTVIPRVQPTRSAITVAGIVGTWVSWARIASSNPSTADPAGLRTYFGGSSLANAARTVFREIFNVLAINLIGNPSARCNLRISAQSSTANNSLLLSAR